MTPRNNSFDTARLTHRQVAEEEIDELGHVNNAVYVRWIQDAATEHWQTVAGNELASKYVWFCSRHEIDYKQQVYQGQSVEIRTWLGEPKGARFDRYIDIRVKGATALAVQAKTTWVLIDKGSGRPVRIKDEIVEAFL